VQGTLFKALLSLPQSRPRPRPVTVWNPGLTTGLEGNDFSDLVNWLPVPAVNMCVQWQLELEGQGRRASFELPGDNDSLQMKHMLRSECRLSNSFFEAEAFGFESVTPLKPFAASLPKSMQNLN
jgi:hypothetical protein